MSLFIPKDYRDPLTIQETQVAIKLAKDTFERKLAKNLNLTRVTAPLFVYPESGLNDNLSGVERPVADIVPPSDGGDRPVAGEVEAVRAGQVRLFPGKACIPT